MNEFRFAVSVMPKEGILDPQGRAVEGSLRHLGLEAVRDVRVGRRVELIASGVDEQDARSTVERLAGQLLANPLVESWTIEALPSSASVTAGGIG